MSKIEHVTQEDEDGCTVACIAMVCGVTYTDVKTEWKRHKKIGTNWYELVRLCEFFGRRTIQYYPPQIAGGSLFIAGVPSNKYPGTIHSIVIDARCSDRNVDPIEVEIYDPCANDQLRYGEKKLPCFIEIFEILPA